MTPEEIKALMPFSLDRPQTFAEPLSAACAEFGISTNGRRAAFLANVAVESGELRYTREIADGTAYELRTDLGNTQPGDGPRFKGRGLLQITGRTNYAACGKALGLDLIENPSLLEVPAGACRSAAWYWKTHGLNELADQEMFGSICHRINGGYNALDQRIRYYIRALRLT